VADEVIARSYVELLPRAANFGRQVGTTVSQQLSKASSQIERQLAAQNRSYARQVQGVTSANNRLAQGTVQAAQKSAQAVGKASRQAADETGRQTMRIGQAWKSTGKHAETASKNMERSSTVASGRISKRFGGMTASVGQSFRGLGAMMAAGLGVAAAATFLKSAIKGASDLNETVSKTEVIFGKQAMPALTKFAERAAATLGQSKQQALDAAATFGVFGKSAGLSGQALAGFSTKMTGLASDMASFSNTSPEEAITAIGAALRGETEPIRRYGVLIDDASTRQQALSMGIIKTTKQALTPQQRVLAVQQLILKQTSAAQGDFARTSGGLANQQRILSAEFTNAKTQLGVVFLPVALAVIRLLNARGIPVFKAFTGGIKALAESWKTGAAGASGFTGVMQRVGIAARIAFDYFKANVLPRLREFAGYLTGTVVPGIARIVAALITSFWPALRTIAVFIGREVIPRIREFASFMGTQVIPRVLEMGRRIAAARDFIVPFVATLIAAKVALAGWAVIARVITLVRLWRNGQIALNLALIANPIGIVVVAIAALVGGLIYAYRNSETARKIMTGAFSAIGQGVVNMAKIGLIAFKFLTKVALEAASTLLNIAAKIPGPQQDAMKKAAKAFDGFKDGVDRSMDAAGKTLDKWAEDLRRMPKIAKLDVEKKDLETKLASVIRQLKNPELTKERKAKLNADKRALELKLTEAQRQINALKGKTVTITYTAAGITAATASGTSLFARRATGGAIRGPGGPTADRVPILASNNEHMWTAKEVAAAGGHAAVKTMRKAVLAGHRFATGGPVVRFHQQGEWASRAQAFAALGRMVGGPALSWARSQAGKPYIWGGVGPRGYDCSGFMSAIANVIRGLSPFRRLGSTGTFPWPGFVRGMGNFSIGSFRGSPGHMAGTLNGVNVESRGGQGVVVGPGARGARNGLFGGNVWHLKGYARGGAIGGDPAFDLMHPRGRKFVGRDVLKQLGLARADQGAWKILRDQMLMVHRGEMVVPPGTAAALRSVYNGARPGRTTDQTPVIHQHFVFPNYVGDKDDLVRAIDELKRKKRI
jgi:cell wall-associated NlpC family hydrolase